jgi:hypothetical protein
MNISDLQVCGQGKEWVSVLFYLFLFAGLFFIQKYIYILDQKLAKYSKRELVNNRKPWALYTGIFLGVFSFLYFMFSDKEQATFIDFKNIWHVLFFIVTATIVITIFYESIRNFGMKAGTIRSIVYVILMALYFYAGFISGLYLITIIALGILIYFIRYFKKLFI